MTILDLIFSILGYDIILMNTIMPGTDNHAGGHRIERFSVGEQVYTLMVEWCSIFRMLLFPIA